MSGAAIILLSVAMATSVYGAGLPFQVNSPPIQSCATNFALDTTTLTDVARGDDSFPCSGYLEYTANGKRRKVCSNKDSFHDSAAERACYTLGVNFYRDGGFTSSTRQMMMYKCFAYGEQNAISANSRLYRSKLVYDAHGYIEQSREDKGCIDGTADSTVFDCFDECHFYRSTLDEYSQYACGHDEPLWALGCTDINECLNGVLDNCTGPFETSCTVRKACGVNAECINHPGSFECLCKDGYEEKDGNEFDPYDLYAGCTDIEECALSPCDLNADCINTVGSYICTCKDGYLGDGHTCSAIPCGTPPTAPNAVIPADQIDPYAYGDEIEYICSTGYKIPVQNIPYSLVDFYGFTEKDSFKLTCDETGHWQPVPMPICSPVSCGEPPNVPFAIRSGTGFLFGQEVTYQCEAGFHPGNNPVGPTYFSRSCQANGTWTSGTTCVDIDECSDNPCDASDYCLNVVGSYLCVFNFPEACMRMNTLSICDHGQCRVQDGIAKCVCEPGYRGVGCDQPDPCLLMEQLGGCVHGECEVKDGKAICQCGPGYHGVGCTEPDPCTLLKTLGSCEHGECETVNGKARCVCDAGYQGAGCNQPGPCMLLEQLNGCDQGDCELTNGRAKCVCNRGFHGVACDQLEMDTNRILAIVALIIAGILMILAISYCFVTFVITRSPKTEAPSEATKSVGYGTYPHAVKPYFSRRADRIF